MVQEYGDNASGYRYLCVKKTKVEKSVLNL